MSLAISFRSETLKLKRTLSVYLCVMAAAFGPMMTFIEYVDPGSAQEPADPWTEHFMRGREPLSIAFIPLYVILICTLLLQIEYRDKTWKQVLSSPQKIINIFFAKFLTLQFLIIAFLVVYNLFLGIVAIVTEKIHPELFDGSINFYSILTVNAQIYLSILGVSAIQFWLSLRFKNFITPLSIGIGLWFLGPMMEFQFKWSIVEQYPYAFSMLSVLRKYEGNIVYYQWYSVATALIFLGLAFVEFRTRKVRS